MQKVFAIAFCWLLLFEGFSQTDTSAEKGKKVKILPVPTFGYSPETETYVGVVSLFSLDFYQDGYTRASNAKVEFTYTWNKQMILELGWDYFFEREKWFSQGKFHVSKYPDRYYGIGSNTPEESETWFDSDRFIGEISLLKSIKPKMFVGPELRYTSYSNVSYNSETDFPELVDRENAVLAAVFLWDTRNNLLNAKEGQYFKSTLGQSWNGEQNSQTIELDVRGYKTWKEKYTVALRSFSDFNFGTPTFYNYSILGGDKYVRGYLFGRYRNQNLSTIQVESRNHLFWRIGLSIFGGYSFLFDDFNEVNSSQFKYNYGGGLRFLVDKKGDINLRFDFAVGENGQTGFYVAFGESF